VARLHRRATGSTLAAEDRLFGRPPSPQSRRRRPKTDSLAGLLPRRGSLDAGDRDPPLWPTAFTTASTPAPPLWPASLAPVSTPATEIRRCGPPHSLWSQRRRQRFAAGARLPRCGLDAGGPGGGPTPAAQDCLFGQTLSPRSRRRRPRSTAVACFPRRGLDVGGRGGPSPSYLVSTPAAEDRLPRRGVPPPSQPAYFFSKNFEIKYSRSFASDALGRRRAACI
jgi:hypothetical protein